jgi:DNA-binding transcriptional ArsR family regulator
MAHTQQAEKKRGSEGVCKILSHPLRVMILEILNEGPMSPSQFVEDGLVPKENYQNYEQALSFAAYHFRELEKAGCIAIIDSIPRRGAVENVYRGLMRVYFTDAEFEELPLEHRERLSRLSFQGLIARASGAMEAGTFDARTDRHLTWMPFEVDERGWKEMMTSMTGCFGEVEQIKHDSADRLAASGERAVRVTFGMVGFESPERPKRPRRKKEQIDAEIKDRHADDQFAEKLKRRLKEDARVLNRLKEND